jgi:S-adenosylmethionine hydrolase
MRNDGNTGATRSAIAVLTDFGVDGFYAGVMRGAMLAADPAAVIADITHGLRPHAIAESSFVLSAVFPYWVEGTVFLAVVDPGVGGPRKNLAALSRNRKIVCPDNGIISDVAVRFGIEEAYAIDDQFAVTVRRHRAEGRTFLGRDVLGPVAAYLAGGGALEGVGMRIDRFERIALPELEVGPGHVRGRSRHVDAFGNVLTNITGDALRQAFGGAGLADIRASINGKFDVRGVLENFSQVAPGELCVILDSWDLIEIAVNKGRAADRFTAGEPVVIELTRK